MKQSFRWVLRPSNAFMDGIVRSLEPCRGWLRPNHITWFRAVLTLPILFLVGRDAIVPLIVLFVIAGVCDDLDGRLARAWSMVSARGAFLDQLTDKLLMVPLLTYLVWWKHANEELYPLLGILCAIEIGLTSVRIYTFARLRRHGIEPLSTSVSANVFGQYKYFAEFVAVFGYIVLGGFKPHEYPQISVLVRVSADCALVAATGLAIFSLRGRITRVASPVTRT